MLALLGLLLLPVWLLSGLLVEGGAGEAIRNIMVNAGVAEMKWIGVLVASNSSGTCTQSSNEIVKCTAPTEKSTGRADGAVTFEVNQAVVFTALTGGAGLQILSQHYFIKEVVSATEIKLAGKEGGAAIKWTTAITAGTLVVLKEPSGAPYKRIATTWGSAAGNVASDTAKEGIKVAAKTTVSFEGFWKAETGGELLNVCPVEPAEPIESEGTYSILTDTFGLTSR